MKYLIAFIFPPLALLNIGKPKQALLNLVLTLLFYFPGVIHALCVLANDDADKRTDRIVNAIKPQNPVKPQPIEQKFFSGTLKLSPTAKPTGEAYNFTTKKWEPTYAE